MMKANHAGEPAVTSLVHRHVISDPKCVIRLYPETKGVTLEEMQHRLGITP